MKKEYDKWNITKKSLLQRARPQFSERDVFWCTMGINIGDEEDGKNDNFNRPVIILRKFNKNLFFGIPLTTKLKQNPYYVEIIFRNRQQAAMISQVRVLDAKRLGQRMGRLSKQEFEKLRKIVRGLF